MSNKVFISFLGTNNYLQTHYELNGKKSKVVRFVQEALIDFICNDWNEEDRIIIFHTEGEKGSKVTNWLDNGQTRFIENEQLERIGLQSVLESKKLLPKIENYSISEGFSEKEVWDIFDTVYQKLNNNDEIYFDITHSFRSIPMFSTVLFNYSHVMKETKIAAVYYGAFEKLGSFFDVRKLDIEKRKAPIINLMNVVRLQEYTDMAYSLTTFGRVKNISKVLANENSELNISIKYLCESIENFDNYLIANRMLDIKSGKCILSMRNHIKAILKLDIPTPIKDVIHKLEDELISFKTEDSFDNVEAAINWAVKYKMLPQAFTLGQEYIISLLANLFADKNPFLYNKKSERKSKFRMFISSLCSISDEDIKNGNFKEPLSGHDNLICELLENEKIHQIRKFYPDLGYYRNQVNHAKGLIDYATLEKSFYDPYRECLSIIKN